MFSLCLSKAELLPPEGRNPGGERTGDMFVFTLHRGKFRKSLVQVLEPVELNQTLPAPPLLF